MASAPRTTGTKGREAAVSPVLGVVDRLLVVDGVELEDDLVLVAVDLLLLAFVVFPPELDVLRGVVDELPLD
jgi:hypothetical protein